MKDKDNETLLEIVFAEGLLSTDQIQLIKSKEALQRSKILKSKTQDIHPEITKIAFLEMHRRSPEG